MRYVPILKAKPAEFTALGWADQRVRAGVLPIIEVIPPSDDTDPAATEAACRVTVDKVSVGWNGSAAVDAGLLDTLLPSPSGLLAVEVLADQARSKGLSFLPVVRPNDDPAVLSATARVIAADKRGAVVRIEGDDLSEDVSTLDSWLVSLEQDIGVQPGDLDVVLDLGAVSSGSSTVALAARVARDFINGASGVSRWRSITVASGAFPENLNAIPSGGTDRIPRLDARLWSDVCKGRLVRNPDFGDYAIQHPSLPPTGGFGPAPQIRYTVDSDWRIYKGRKGVRRGHAQFYDICAKLVASSEFAGRSASRGDQYVDDAAASATGTALVGTGNASTWRAVGTSHHLATVVNRLATTGAP